MTEALKILQRQIEARGRGAAARELGISKTSVSLYLSGKYGAAVGNIERKILKLYGAGDRLLCPHTANEITPEECAATHGRAEAVGLKATGNPVTLRQYHACLKCAVRN